MKNHLITIAAYLTAFLVGALPQVTRASDSPCLAETQSYVAAGDQESFVPMILCFQLTDWNAPHSRCDGAAETYADDQSEVAGRALETCLSEIDETQSVISVDPDTGQLSATAVKDANAIKDIRLDIVRSPRVQTNDCVAAIQQPDGTIVDGPCE